MKLEIRCGRTFAGWVKLATSRQQNGNLSVRWGFSNRLRNDEGAPRMSFGMQVRGGLTVALILFAVPVATTLAAGLVSSSAAAQAVSSIAVEGNRRVESDTIRSYFKPGPGG